MNTRSLFVVLFKRGRFRTAAAAVLSLPPRSAPPASLLPPPVRSLFPSVARPFFFPKTERTNEKLTTNSLLATCCIVNVFFLFFLRNVTFFYSYCVLAPSPGQKSGIRMMAAEDLRPEMDRRVKDVTEVLGVSTAAAAVLMREHNWSKEDLLERYMNDPDKVLKSAGVYCRCGHAQEKPNPKDDNTCPICYDDADAMLSMPCGHAFCQECWYDFCVNAVDEEGPSCVSTTCPQAGCTEVVTEEEMAKALGDKSPALLKYNNYQLRSFVESNPLTRWCPGAGCERVACALSPAMMEAEGKVADCDTCDKRFCLVCGEEPHAPATCKDLALWQEKCKNESETANWILANTKSCPKVQYRHSAAKPPGCSFLY